MNKIEFCFDFGSPTSYFAWNILRRIRDTSDTEITWHPMLLGGVFKATGNTSPVAIPAKGAYMGADMQRFAEKYEIDHAFNDHFPINTLVMMRGAAGLLGDDRFEDYVTAVYEAIWKDNKNMGDIDVAGQVLVDAGFDPAEFMALVNDGDVKDKLKALTEDAVERGVFGAPTMFVGDQMFFGQDRMHFVAETVGVNICDIIPNYIKA
jgi:2-hydroxychromene-2-carboxylate isomerase